jgi:thioredoxin reductase (NADPH)
MQGAVEQAPRLVLYSREYCHLCHDMLAALEPLQGEFRFELEVIDVDSDTELERCFNELVPLLMHGQTELARWRLDVDALRAYLAEFG